MKVNPRGVKDEWRAGAGKNTIAREFDVA